MADFVFNIAKGRAAELHRRVDGGDPAASRLKVMVFSGAVADDTLNNADTVADAVSSGLTLLTANGWNIKTLTGTELAVPTVDDTANRQDCDMPDQTWTGVSSGTSTRIIVGYSPDGSDTTSQIVPMTCHDFAVTPDGSDVTAVVNAAGYYRAA